MTALIILGAFPPLAAGFYLALSRDLFRVVLGLALVGSGVNLLLFASGRVERVLPAIVPPGDTVLVGAANPLPQALVLTAIVIGLALVCFALVLAMRLIQTGGATKDADDVAALRASEPRSKDPVLPPEEER